jgi:hypothetical protein
MRQATRRVGGGRLVGRKLRSLYYSVTCGTYHDNAFLVADTYLELLHLYLFKNFSLKQVTLLYNLHSFIQVEVYVLYYIYTYTTYIHIHTYVRILK